MTSIILNFNKNLENSEAFKYSQFFDNNINIPENAQISLNNCQLTRKAIVIEEDAICKLLFSNLGQGQNTASVFDCKTSFEIQDLTFTIPKGNYTKRQFLNLLYGIVDDTISDYNSAADTINYSKIEYKAFVKNTNDTAAFGLALNYPTLNYRYHNDARMQNQMTLSLVDGVRFLKPTGTQSSDFNTFAFAQSGFNPFNFDIDNIAQSSITFGIFDRLSENVAGTHQYAICFTNQVNASIWTTATDMEIQELPNVALDVPKAYIGMIIVNNYDGSNITTQQITVYQSDNLADFTNEEFLLDADVALGNMVLMNTFQVRDANKNQRFAIQFYQDNDYNAADEVSQKNYYRILTYNLQVSPTDIIQPNNQVIFDSRVYGKTISNDLIQRNFLMDDIFGAQYASGLVPCFAMSGTFATSSADEGFFDIQAPFINDGGSDYNDLNLANTCAGIANYSIGLGSSVQNIFGSDIILKINPNASTDDKYHTSDFCVSQFFQDNTSYNIQIDNLPIKTYQSVSVGDRQNCNVGTKKPIIMKVNNLFEGSVSGVNESRLVKSHYENYPKKMSLNNKYKIDLNTMDVSIRRSKSNELATEIVDASIEITIN